MLSPVTSTPCVAFGVAVTTENDVLLRDGACAAFRVELDQGGHVLVPSGRARIEVPAATADAGAARALLVENVPMLGDERRWDPGDVAGREVLVQPGARVEIFADYAIEPDPAVSASSPFRGVSATRRVARGAPVIRVLAAGG